MGTLSTLHIVNIITSTLLWILHIYFCILYLHFCILGVPKSISICGLYINIVYNNKCNIVHVNFVAIVKRKKAEVHGREEESEGIGQRNDTQTVGNGSMFYQAGHATFTIAGIFPRPAIIGQPLTLATSAR